MRHWRGQNRLCPQLSTAIAIDICIRFCAMTSPADTGTCAESRNSMADLEFYSEIGSNSPGLRLTNQFAVTRKGQRGSVRSSDRTSSFDHPAHRRLKLRQGIRQRAACNPARGTIREVLGRRGCNPLFRKLAGHVVAEDVLYRTIDKMVVNHGSLLLIAKRTTEDVSKCEQRRASTG